MFYRHLDEGRLPQVTGDATIRLIRAHGLIGRRCGRTVGENSPQATGRTDANATRRRGTREASDRRRTQRRHSTSAVPTPPAPYPSAESGVRLCRSERVPPQPHGEERHVHARAPAEHGAQGQQGLGHAPRPRHVRPWSGSGQAGRPAGAVCAPGGRPHEHAALRRAHHLQAAHLARAPLLPEPAAGHAPVHPAVQRSGVRLLRGEQRGLHQPGGLPALGARRAGRSRSRRRSRHGARRLPGPAPALPAHGDDALLRRVVRRWRQRRAVRAGGGVHQLAGGGERGAGAAREQHGRQEPGGAAPLPDAGHRGAQREQQQQRQQQLRARRQRRELQPAHVAHELPQQADEPHVVGGQRAAALPFPPAGERGVALLAPVHPGPEDGHAAARRRRLRGEEGAADAEVRPQHLGLARSAHLRHAGLPGGNQRLPVPQQVLRARAVGGRLPAGHLPVPAQRAAPAHGAAGAGDEAPASAAVRAGVALLLPLLLQLAARHLRRHGAARVGRGGRDDGAGFRRAFTVVVVVVVGCCRCGYNATAAGGRADDRLCPHDLQRLSRGHHRARRA
ncbi:uncharacterized protein LOC144947339 isoform X2 [Lampetra fluviatilis]